MNTTGRKTVKGRTTSAPKKIEKSSARTSNELSEATAESAADSQPTATTAGTRSAPSREEIALRAYQLYLARGSEPGHDSEDWLSAEAELAI